MRVDLLIGAALAMIGAPKTDNPKVVADKFVADYQKAVQGRNPGFLDTHVTPDFIYMGSNGERFHKGDLAKFYKSIDKMVTLKSIRMRILYVRPDRDKIQLVVSSSMDVKSANVITSNPQFKEEFVLVKVKDRWLVKRGRQLGPASAARS